jgi:short-subunit dehydrogenase
MIQCNTLGEHSVHFSVMHPQVERMEYAEVAWQIADTIRQIYICSQRICMTVSTLKINVISPVLLVKACYPMLKKAGGNVVYVGSVADFKRDARYSIYGGSK